MIGNIKYIHLLYHLFVLSLSLSLSITRVEIYSSEDKKKENGIKHTVGMTSIRNEVDVQSENFEGHLNFLHAIRTQMQARQTLSLR